MSLAQLSETGTYTAGRLSKSVEARAGSLGYALGDNAVFRDARLATEDNEWKHPSRIGC